MTFVNLDTMSYTKNPFFRNDSNHLNLTKLRHPRFDSLLERKRFCLWKYERLKDNSKLSKVPYILKTNRLTKANIKIRTNWITGHDALTIVETNREVDGIGIVLIDSNIFAIDLDSCLNPETGQLSKQAQVIVDQFYHTYIEISPSGQGLHILGQGKLNLLGRNKSLNNQRIEAYDGSSVRYMTITGNLWNNTTELYSYSELSLPIQWFKTNFFQKEIIAHKYSSNTNQIKTYPQNTKSSILNTSLIHSNLINSLNFIVSQIKNSIDNLLFKQLCQGIKIRKSLSEDDWLFCQIVLRYIPTDETNLTKELLKQMLLKYRHRMKLERSDYINRTIDKILLTNSSRGTVQEKHKIHAYKKQTSISHSHVVKSCSMLQSIFTLSKQKYHQVYEYKIWQDENNNLTVQLTESLSAIDLNIYVALILLLKQKKLITQQSKDKYSQLNSTIPKYTSITITFTELSQTLGKADGGRFRKSILEAIQRLSNVIILYKKSINTGNKIIQGQSRLLNWYLAGDKYHKSYVHIGINRLSWIILQEATINYCLLNTNVMFQLPTLELQFLYNYICYTIPVNMLHFTQISIEKLVNVLWFPTLNSSTYRSRKIRIRKWCQQLSDLQKQLIDMEIRLVYKKTSNNSFIDQIFIRRYKVKLKLENKEYTDRLTRINLGPNPRLSDRHFPNDILF